MAVFTTPIYGYRRNIISWRCPSNRILYKIKEYNPLLDSSNMAGNVDDELFDGFVVIHGTDTLAYTASALSFMLDNLAKPVDVTGSQIPIYETSTDAKNNLVSSLIIAGCYKIPEIRPAPRDKLLAVTGVLEKNLDILKITPDISTNVIRSALEEPIMGVVLESYGSGYTLKQDRNNLSSTASLAAIYDAGAVVEDVGVLSGSDITSEAAHTKLA
ncbi:blast:L-asparaginase [Drosophila guanche]|uniref:asparaginase n=1 Tax=Drosophila guanche TaxID=7266 RepID=A0A3B0JHN7_DROGU|nr:blast:L-asparaginase [Drosophila guanche]